MVFFLNLLRGGFEIGAPGRTGRTVQGTKWQAQMSHTIGSAHLQQAVFNICDCIVNICMFALSADILSPLVCTKSYRYLGLTDQDMVWGRTNYALLCSVVENSNINCSWVFWIFFATSTEISSIFGKESGRLFGMHSWTFGGWGGILLERVEGGRLATPQNVIVYLAFHTSTVPKSVKNLPTHSYNWGPTIELPPYPPNIPGISNPGMALGSDFILSQSMKSQIDYSWSIMC
jgi:hypothetical protein